MDCREKISALALHAEADSFEEELSAELAGVAEAGNTRSRLVAIWMASRRLDLLFSRRYDDGRSRIRQGRPAVGEAEIPADVRSEKELNTC